ncbi:MAG TPA: glutamate--tRNA ligase [Stellaceae bacterium]|nr:glutamate--tRNA ligase [Stellaceae bacterium]
MTVIVRFAPSPTGFLHIGGARTALFNWLFARHNGGTFRLRIEDTDRERSTKAAEEAIVDGLKWLGIEWDGDVAYQFSRAAHHAEIAHRLLEAGRAYRCYCTPEELEAMRATALAEKRSVRYDGTWRDRDPADAPQGVAPAIRLKAEQTGATTIRDHVLGEVTVGNEELDDLIILRSDGTPTYNFSVVVDDFDMGITHVIRGDDHLRNAFRQRQIYDALGWPVPRFGHVPLIHGADGAKLSKRHGAIGVEQYRELGYLPEALRNYLLRLGWSHGDDEIISTDQAIEWFDIADVGRAAARFDPAKLDNVNTHYIRDVNTADDDRLARLIAGRLERELGRALSKEEEDRVLRGMPGLRPRGKTIVDLAEKAKFYIGTRPHLNESASILLRYDRGDTSIVRSPPDSPTTHPRGILSGIKTALEAIPAEEWPNTDSMKIYSVFEAPLRQVAESRHVLTGNVMELLGAALGGSPQSPGLYIALSAFGRDEVLRRIDDALGRSGGQSVPLRPSFRGDAQRRTRNP